jgi:hypothetical protein
MSIPLSIADLAKESTVAPRDETQPRPLSASNPPVASGAPSEPPAEPAQPAQPAQPTQHDGAAAATSHSASPFGSGSKFFLPSTAVFTQVRGDVMSVSELQSSGKHFKVGELNELDGRAVVVVGIIIHTGGAETKVTRCLLLLSGC